MEEEIMNFFEYMMHKYLDTGTKEADLANDMQYDGDFPRDGDHDTILEHLESMNACSAAIDVFESCWKEYANK